MYGKYIFETTTIIQWHSIREQLIQFTAVGYCFSDLSINTLRKLHSYLLFLTLSKNFTLSYTSYTKLF